MNPRPENAETHFGFRSVRPSEKAALVREVFDNVATRYDVMNDAMSFGLHRVWKNAMIDALNPTPGTQLLDMAGGTGDIAFRFLKHRNNQSNSFQATVCDINQHMLEEGRNRALNQNILHGIEFLCADAQSLPLPDSCMDAYTIAFGIRNVTDIAQALREARRVLKPGGRFLCLEFSHVPHETLAKIYDFYSFKMIPALGKLIAGKAEPYQYLVESIRRFPNQEAFAAMIREAGFSQVSYRNMNGGVVALHSGWRV